MEELTFENLIKLDSKALKIKAIVDHADLKSLVAESKYGRGNMKIEATNKLKNMISVYFKAADYFQMNEMYLHDMYIHDICLDLGSVRLN